MSGAREVGLASGRGYVLMTRMVSGAAARFDGPYSLERAKAEREWKLANHSMARCSIFALRRLPGGAAE